MRRALDLLLGLAAIAIPALLLLADQVASALPPYHHIKITPGLVGVTEPIDPALTFARVLDGRWQAAAAQRVGSLSPLYPFAVRLKNQVLYSVFGLSGTPSITVGRGGSLLETGYIEEYCSRDLARFQQQAADWAPKLRQLQDAFAKRGKTFLYVITPSKVAQYPDLIPRGYPCPAPPGDRTGLLPMWRRALERAGVHYADTTLPVMAAHGRYPFVMYPPGGTHWNTVGAALATGTIAAALDNASVPAPGFTWTMTPRPIWPDDDLASLMNVLGNIRRYAVPQVTLSAQPPAQGCRTLSIAIVGGSFMNRPGEDLAQGPCAPRVEEWQYWTVFDITWDHAGLEKQPVDAAARDARLLATDILLYEENEELVARSQHGPALYGFIGRNWGLPAPEPAR